MAKTGIVLGLQLFLVFNSFSQLVFTSNEHDIGVIRRADSNWADYEIKNFTTKEAVIFRVEGSDWVDTKISEKIIQPEGVGFIRVAVTPSREGDFKEELLVYASSWNEPQKLILKGSSTFKSSSLIPCPNFGKTQSADGEFHFSIRKPNLSDAIENASIRIYQNGKLIENLKSNEYGESSTSLAYGRYYFVVEGDSYQLDTAMYVNAVSDHLLAVVEEVEPEQLEPKDTPVETPTYVQRSLEEEFAESDSEISVDSDEVLPLSKFKKNNLVFLVDVSSSMKSNGKIDLLKIAMIDLLEVLRDVDRFSLVSYASGTEILLETEGNLNREACVRTIMNLEAKGSTAGADAIKKAAELALAHFINEGNNQVILATDGAFNDGVKRASRIARDYKEKGVELSVIGIKCAPYTEREMRELVESSEGRYIPIRSDTEAGNQLIGEIKKSSMR